LEENVPAAALSLYPNPAADWLTLQLDRPQAEQAMMEIYALTGQRMPIGTQVWMPGTVQQQIDVSQLPAGTYIVRVQAGQQYWTEKFTVSRY
jgi:hypothetical protein